MSFNVTSVLDSLNTKKRWCLLPTNVTDDVLVPMSLNNVAKTTNDRYIQLEHDYIQTLRLACMSSLPGVVVVETTTNILYHAIAPTNTKCDVVYFRNELNKLAWGVLVFDAHSKTYNKIPINKLFEQNQKIPDILVIAKFAHTRTWGIVAGKNPKFRLHNDDVPGDNVSAFDFRDRSNIIRHMNKDLLLQTTSQNGTLYSTARISCNVDGNSIKYAINDADHLEQWGLITAKDINAMVAVVTTDPSQDEKRDTRDNTSSAQPPDTRTTPPHIPSPVPPPQGTPRNAIPDQFNRLLNTYAESFVDTKSKEYLYWGLLNNAKTGNEDAKKNAMIEIFKNKNWTYYQTFKQDKRYIKKWMLFLEKSESGKQAASHYNRLIGSLWNDCKQLYKRSLDESNLITLQGFQNTLATKFRTHAVYKYLEEAKWYGTLQRVRQFSKTQGLNVDKIDAFCTYDRITKISTNPDLFATFKTFVMSWLTQLYSNIENTFVTPYAQEFVQSCQDVVTKAMQKVHQNETRDADTWCKLLDKHTARIELCRRVLWTKTYGFYHASLSTSGWSNTLLPFIRSFGDDGVRSLSVVPTYLFYRMHSNVQNVEDSWKDDANVVTGINNLVRNTVRVPADVTTFKQMFTPMSLNGLEKRIQQLSRVGFDDFRGQEDNIACICAAACRSAQTNLLGNKVNVYVFLKSKPDDVCLVGPDGHEGSRPTIVVKVQRTTNVDKYRISEITASEKDTEATHVNPPSSITLPVYQPSPRPSARSDGGDTPSRRSNEASPLHTTNGVTSEQSQASDANNVVPESSTQRTSVATSQAATQAYMRCKLTSIVVKAVLVTLFSFFVVGTYFVDDTFLNEITTACNRSVNAASQGFNNTRMEELCDEAQTQGYRLENLAHVILEQNANNAQNVGVVMKGMFLAVLGLLLFVFQPGKSGLPVWAVFLFQALNSMCATQNMPLLQPWEIVGAVAVFDASSKYISHNFNEQAQKLKDSTLEYWGAECDDNKTSTSSFGSPGAKTQVKYTCQFDYNN